MNRPPWLTVVLLLFALLSAGCARLSALPAVAPESAADVNGVTSVVFRSPTCSCCHEHQAYLSAAGIEVSSVIDANVVRIKESYGVPAQRYSCHTADIAGYFVEGHVPLAAVEKLLAEAPDLDGIALPGMPAGSPGMGGLAEGSLTVYAVKDGEVVSVFGEY